MGHKKAFTAVVVAFVLSFAIACGSSPAQVEKKVKDIAIAMGSAMISGPEAEKKRQQIFEILKSEEMSLDQVQLKEADMDNHVRLAYGRDARKTLVQLRNLQASPQQAVDTYDKLTSELRNAQMSFGNLETTELLTRQHLGRNSVEHMKNNGIQPTVAQYKAGGMIVPKETIVRRVIRRVPAPAPRSARATKPAPRKPTTTPRRNGG